MRKRSCLHFRKAIQTSLLNLTYFFFFFKILISRKNRDILSLQNCGESVSSVEGGVVGSAGFDEIIATTYTGWVFGLTTENVESRARLQRDSISSTSTTNTSVFDTDNAVKIKLEKLRRELDIIQSRVVEEREK